MKINSHHIITENEYIKAIQDIKKYSNPEAEKAADKLSKLTGLSRKKFTKQDLYKDYVPQKAYLEFILYATNNQQVPMKGNFTFYFLYTTLYIFRGSNSTPITIQFEDKNLGNLKTGKKYKIKSIDIDYSYYDLRNMLNIKYHSFELIEPQNGIKKSKKLTSKIYKGKVFSDDGSSVDRYDVEIEFLSTNYNKNITGIVDIDIDPNDKKNIKLNNRQDYFDIELNKDFNPNKPDIYNQIKMRLNQTTNMTATMKVNKIRKV
jgi:hypothetical protein